MTTLNILTERVIRQLSGGDVPDDSPYDFEDVMATVIDCLREDMKLEMLQRRGGDEDDRGPVTQAIATYPNIEVKRDDVSGRTYIDLPSAYMSLKYNAGIRGIADMKSPLTMMIPVTNPSITSRLQHGDFERVNFGYYAEGQKVYWIRDILKERISKVLVKLMVAAPDGSNPDEPLPVVPENVARILDAATKRVLNQFPNDRLNDGNPNIRAANG